MRRSYVVNYSVVKLVTIPNVAMRYVSRYLGHDAIRIAILVYRVSQCLDLQQKKLWSCMGKWDRFKG